MSDCGKDFKVFYLILTISAVVGRCGGGPYEHDTFEQKRNREKDLSGRRWVCISGWVSTTGASLQGALEAILVRKKKSDPLLRGHFSENVGKEKPTAQAFPTEAMASNLGYSEYRCRGDFVSGL